MEMVLSLQSGRPSFTQVVDAIEEYTGRQFDLSSLPEEYRDTIPTGPFSNMISSHRAPFCSNFSDHENNSDSQSGQSYILSAFRQWFCRTLTVGIQYYEFGKIMEASFLPIEKTGSCYLTDSPLRPILPR